MATTIQLSFDLLNELKARKFSERETYEDVILDLLEDTKELSAETRKDIERARMEIKSGEYYSLNQVKSELDI